jgi:hypothetical protein
MKVERKPEPADQLYLSRMILLAAVYRTQIVNIVVVTVDLVAGTPHLPESEIVRLPRRTVP